MEEGEGGGEGGEVGCHCCVVVVGGGGGLWWVVVVVGIYRGGGGGGFLAGLIIDVAAVGWGVGKRFFYSDTR